MTAVMLALLAVLIAGLGARDQLTVAGLSRSIGQRPASLIAAFVVCCATATFAGWAATTVAPLMTSPARHLLAAMALAFAGGEALLLPPGRSAEEATHSLFALTVVLLAQQLTDAARFLIFGVALATGDWIPAVLGGAIGGMILLSAAWALPDAFTWQRLRWLRRGLGVAMLILALWLALPLLNPS